MAGTIGVAGNGAAEQSDDEIYEQSLLVREKADLTVEEWHSYLTKRGLSFGSKQLTVINEVSQGDSDGVSKQKLDRHESKFTMTYYEGSGYDAVDLSWNHDASQANDYGADPPDGASIHYASDHYDRTYDVDDWVYYGQNAKDPNGFDSKNPNHGAACIFKDGLIPQDNDGYFGIRVEPNTNLSSTDRELEFDYRHTWSNGTLKSISIGTGGISFTFSDGTFRWDWEESYREEDIDDGGITKDPGTA
ncbi:MAG: hypothetical protein ABEI75_00145 [Halobaculum sp.]